MTTLEKIITFLLHSVLGIIISIIVFYIVGNVLIPDECYYHSNEPNWFVSLIFDFPGWNGYHPFPSYFQLGLIVVFGIYLSYRFCKKRMKL